MHILVLPSWYPHSYKPLLGIFFKEQAEILAKYGNKVGIIAIQPIDIMTIITHKKINFQYEKYIENKVQTYKVQYPEIPKVHKIKEFMKIYFFKKIFKKYMKENGIPDIVHLHSFMHGELAIWLKESYNIPFILTEHSSGFARNLIKGKLLTLSKKIFLNSDLNIAVSQKFTILLNNITEKKFIYIPNIVDIDFFELKVNKNKNKFNFINIAFYRKNKNQGMLIKAFTKSFKGQKSITLTLVGGGPEYVNLNKLIIDLKMEEQISLKGEASREEVKSLLQEANAFVLSSEYETFGVVLIEAMACGLPVVATKCGGAESIVENKKVGILVDINENAISKALVYLYQNIETYDSQYIRTYVEENFSEEAVYSKLKNIYALSLVNK